MASVQANAPLLLRFSGFRSRFGFRYSDFEFFISHA